MASMTCTTTIQETRFTRPHDVYGDFNYYLDPGDGSLPEPQNVFKPSSFLDKPKDTRRMLVRDVRGKENQFNLDKNGFQFYRHVSKEKDFVDDKCIEEKYYPEVEQMVKAITGASRVHIYNHIVRREADNSNSTAYTTKPRLQSKTQQGPLRRVHIDQSYNSAPQEVYYHMPQEADRLLKGRFQLLNVWRPIKPIYRDPLGVVDARTVSEDDLVPVKIIYPNKEGETLVVKPGGEKGKELHKWYYMYGQKPEEVLIFKIYDSETGKARSVPHSAFENVEEKHQPPRESIEVRCLVFHE